MGQDTMVRMTQELAGVTVALLLPIELGHMLNLHKEGTQGLFRGLWGFLPFLSWQLLWCQSPASAEFTSLGI
jgi:hypothetical protein